MNKRITKWAQSYLLPGALLLSVSAFAAPAKKADTKPEFRVGNLIESGSFANPKGWTLKKYHVSKGRISLKGVRFGRGTASTPFLGPDGYYKIRIKYLDEGDGVSHVQVLINKKVVGSWAFDGILVNSVRWKSFDGIKINKGDTITLKSHKGGNEYARIYGIEILPSKPLPKPDVGSVSAKKFSTNLVPVNPPSKYLLSPTPFFRGGSGSYLVYLEKGKPFVLRAWSDYAGNDTSVQCSLTKQGATTPVFSKTEVSKDSEPILLQPQVSETGLYTLKMGPAPKVSRYVRVTFNAPYVRTLPSSGGYIYVPKGTKAFSVKTSGHAVAMDDNNKVMLDQWFTNEQTAVVKVPAGSDGQVWSFQGKIEALTGIPPYVSNRRSAMLAPAETLK